MSKSKPRPRSIHSDEYKLFVEMLREERKKLGIKQRALSEKLGQHHTYINLIERNARQINVIELYHLCKALRVPLPDFVKRLDDALGQMEIEGASDPLMDEGTDSPGDTTKS